MITPIECHTSEEHTNALAHHHPSDNMFASKNESDSVLRLFLEGLAQEMIRSEDYLKSLDQVIPDETSLFLDEWERVLGIPDDCFDGEGDNATRRGNILVKLASLGVQTVEDFENLALVFGVTITVIPGNDYWLAPGFPFVITEEESRYYIVVEFVNPDPGFPYTFPFTFGADYFGILECLYRKLKPANCEVLFTEV
jgi:uncharacterized protein YmfQ (DUF2313 family)